MTTQAPAVPAWKSLLFAPADNSARCAKACTIETGAVILDLEDGVAAVAKDTARAQIAGAAAALKQAGRGVVVRVNAAREALARDLAAATGPDVDAIMLPKASAAAHIVALAEMLSARERERGLSPGSVGVIALIEEPAAIGDLFSIAAAPRLTGLALGTEDLCLGLGVAPTREALDLPCRLLALAAASRGLMALCAPISIAQFRDVEAYGAALREAAAYGATGAICIHPNQVAAANDVFRPSQAACEDARRVLAAWDEAERAGQSVTALDGRMIDLPVAERARRLLARN